MRMKTAALAFVRDENGATAIEYGLLAALIGVGIITAITQLSGNLNALFGGLATTFGGLAH